ncbi:MAG TPA: ABC transporter ATP-binding protein [Thermoanaerobaculia bacterium]
MNDLRRLFDLFRPHRRAAAVAIVAMLGVAFFTVVVAYLLRPLFDQVLTQMAPAGMAKELEPGSAAAQGLSAVLGGDGVKKTALIRFLDRHLADLQDAIGMTKENRVFILPLMMFAAFLAKNLCTYTALYRFNAVGLAFVRDVRDAVYRRLLAQSEAFYAKNPSGDLISRVTGDVDRIQSLFGTDLADLVQSVATLAGLVVYVVSLSPELTLVVSVVAPAIVVPVVVIARGLRQLSKSGREQMGDLTGVLSETLRGHRVVQAYGAETYEATRFEQVNQRTFHLLRKAARVMAVSSPLLESASVLAFLVLIVYAGSRIRGGTMTLGVVISFGASLAMMYQPLKRATRINLALQQALASARRLFEVLDAPIAVVDQPQARAMAPFGREIRFEGVSFAYPGRGRVLQGVDLAVPRGAVVALVGPSGAGKTTLVSLLPRFMDPQLGRITVDGVDVRDLTLASLRASIGLVTQEVVLFDDTIRHNVAYGRDGVPEAAIRAALRAANAEAFVDDVPGGLDARIGEAGGRLSGGQRQRLAIARALLKDPPILVLDEATSSLDTESERAVQEALEHLMAGRTTIVIAHRLSTVRRADQIVAIEEGRIVERGTHAELLAAGGLYRRLHDLQAFSGEGEETP